MHWMSVLEVDTWFRVWRIWFVRILASLYDTQMSDQHPLHALDVGSGSGYLVSCMAHMVC